MDAITEKAIALFAQDANIANELEAAMTFGAMDAGTRNYYRHQAQKNTMTDTYETVTRKAVQLYADAAGITDLQNADDKFATLAPHMRGHYRAMASSLLHQEQNAS